MNPTNILNDIYEGNKPKQTPEEIAALKEKEQALWISWTKEPISARFLHSLDNAFRQLIDECMTGVVRGDITDVQLRTKIMEAASITRVLQAAHTDGKY